MNSNFKIDNCEKALCKSQVVSPFKHGQPVITSAKKWKNTPFDICPNCLEELKKKHKKSLWARVEHYMDTY